MEEESSWLDSDELRVVACFLDAEVQFLVVGGRAVQFHGVDRPAKDLDLLVEFSADNWAKLRVGLQPLNAGVPAFEKMTHDRPKHGTLAFYPTVEILTEIRGVCFADAWADSVTTTFCGLSFRIISKNHLIVSKRGSKRDQDIADVRALSSA